jgi:hypothetical protein
MRNDDLNRLWRSSMGTDHPSDVRDGTLQHKGEDNIPPRNTVPFAQRAFPPDAMATIYRPARSAMISGEAKHAALKLRFEPRTALFLEPLMGWTGATDTPVPSWTPQPPRPRSRMPKNRASYRARSCRATQDCCPT